MGVIELTGQEQELLGRVLDRAYRDLKEEIYKTETAEFKRALREDERTLEALMAKIGLPVPIAHAGSAAASAVVDRELRYGFGRRVATPYPQAVEQTKAALQEEGFGVLFEIDVQRVMKEKRGTDFRPYVILGACNPQLAHRALEAEIDLGLLLPCNVVVYAEDGGSVVMAMDPEAALGLVGNPALHALAQEVKTRLRRAIERIR